MIKINDGTDEIINQIESVTSYTELCKIKEYYEDNYKAASCGKIYYTVRKSAFETKFDITLSNGREIGKITIKGDYDTVPAEVHKAVIEGYKIQTKKLLSSLNDKIHQVEEDKSENFNMYDWVEIIFCICGFIGTVFILCFFCSIAIFV